MKFSMKSFGALLGLSCGLLNYYGNNGFGVSAFTPSISAFGVCRSASEPSFLNSAVAEETATAIGVTSSDKIR